jgi:hypothetical protein
MGDRAYIQIESQRLERPVLLYGHWSGTDNLQAVRNVLEKTARIGDVPYLTASLFWEFAKLGSYDGSLSFGIEVGDLTDSPTWMLDNPIAFVNADSGQYIYDGGLYNEFALPITTDGVEFW